MDPKFDGPNVFLVLASISNELADQADHKVNSVYLLSFDKKFKTCQEEQDKKTQRNGRNK